MERCSGILLHISSLPGPYGIGTFGKCAYDFTDFLKDSRQHFWQILPLGATSFGDSPYQSPSAFALNPYFIDFELLREDGLLEKSDYDNYDFGQDDYCIDFKKIYINKEKVLRKAFKKIKENSFYFNSLKKQFLDFIKINSFWLDDYSLFMALKLHFNGIQWNEWDKDIKFRKQNAICYYKEKYTEEIQYFQFIQFIANKQWKALKNYINQQDIQIIGDIPIYAAGDSADCWVNSQTGIFKFDNNLDPSFVAGCPPDYFSSEGQYWGNPVYNWDVNKDLNYVWWISRIEHSLKIYDWIRLDHFRGLESYWEIPYNYSATLGSWRKGPDIDFINIIKSSLGNVNIIAEDLGFMTDGVKELLKQSGFPGMRVLAFAFDSGKGNNHLPHNYEKNCVAYTGTHDNDTIIGWFEHTSEESKKRAANYLKLDIKEGYNWGFIRGIFSSNANLAIVPMQDILGLGSEARMNIPSTLGGQNWKWRMKPNSISKELIEKLKEITELYER
ncbi:4-alpha-glucanotransferase [Anaerovorax odorimutans]|uniref:4-alpha-glucanotransferase n=1 Tax=Anaerovorax odorimutans TaxID=109327 RepID=UPI00040921EF|nr:4-alpha-glucanotransferase [Anaerovorax odorimutans]